MDDTWLFLPTLSRVQRAPSMMNFFKGVASEKFAEIVVKAVEEE